MRGQKRSLRPDIEDAVAARFLWNHVDDGAVAPNRELDLDLTRCFGFWLPVLSDSLTHGVPSAICRLTDGMKNVAGMRFLSSS